MRKKSRIISGMMKIMRMILVTKVTSKVVMKTPIKETRMIPNSGM
jgi:hypothetical protein